ncbi:MAG: hypothetical protein D6740_08785 [Alphaproteobacteria bacterium]|nr:MAG: hypothetical protein D6740_08785 [Alphaproteobacteria bacterium]
MAIDDPAPSLQGPLQTKMNRSKGEETPGKKRMRLARLAIAILLPLAGVVALALHQGDHARAKRLFAERVFYHRHLRPPENPAELFVLLGYRASAVPVPRTRVPRRFLAALPKRMGDLEDVRLKKELFVTAVLPLVLRANELIAEDRATAERLKTKIESGRALNRYERRWLAAQGRRFAVPPGLEPGTPAWFAALLLRLDTIPPSLALAQAAIESGWGTARFAREGNALFGQWTWKDSERGIVPLKRPKGARYRIRAFDYLIDSVRAYMLNLNHNPAYREFRYRRAALRRDGIRDHAGLKLAGTLIRYSTRREAYVAELRTVIVTNRLARFDGVTLEPAMPAG